MELTPRDKDKLMLFTAAQLAERRKARGLKLNYPEAVALISFEIMEGARDGRSVADLMSYGREILTRDDVIPCAFQCVRAQAKSKGNCFRTTFSSDSLDVSFR